MPRKAPTQVIEQRITLGDLERSQVIPILDETRQLLKTANLVTRVSSGVAIASTVALTVGAVGLGIAGYAVYDWVNESSLLEDVHNWIERKKRNVKSTLAGDGPTTHGKTNIFGLPGWGLWEGII